jgi:hypothetical protein
MKTEYFEVRLYVTGTKKRERKNKRHGLTLTNVPITAQAGDALTSTIEEARKVAQEKMKSIVAGTAHISFCYTSEDTRTPDMKTSEPFNELSFQLKVEV